jgi:hypothetical protein
MTAMTLKEAAAEVLNATRANAPKEPMQNLQAVRGKQPNAGSGPDNANDLGGATHEDPNGGDVGARAVALRSKANPPGQLPDASSKEEMKKLPKQPAEDQAGAVSSPAEYDSDAAPSGGPLDTDVEYMQSANEEVELTPEELEEAKKEKMDKVKEKLKQKNCKEDIDAIFSGETLSEEFRVKLTTIFESAVVTRALEVVEEMEQDILTAAEETVEEIKEELEEKIDTYMTYMVEEWKKENEVAIERGLQVEVVEDFMEGLKALFEEHYIDTSSEKMDLAAKLAGDVEALEEKLNGVMNSNVELSKKVTEAVKRDVLNTVCEGLTATQAAKVKTLAESVEFTTEGEFAQKVKIIRESYTNTSAVKVKGSIEKSVALTESIDEPVTEEAKTIDPDMKAINDALDRTQRGY